MPDSIQPRIDALLGSALISAETLYQDTRERLSRVLAKAAKKLPFSEVIGLARELLMEVEPIFAAHLRDTELAAWLMGFQWTSDRLPFFTEREFLESLEGPPQGPVGRLMWPWEAEQPRVRFPQLEIAAESMADRGVLSRPEFDRVSDEIKLRTFTVAGDHTEDTLNMIRDILYSDIKEGTSLRGFQEKFADVFEKSPIGPAHLETVYRTNVQSTFRDGRESLVSHPIVNEVFPYQEYLPTHDARTRPEHRELENLGLDGTGIYRRDDPFWERFTPPWDYNCRCGVNLLTLAKAAERGIREAKEWLESGTPPANPEYRSAFVKFEVKPGFGQRGRVVAGAYR